MVPFSTTLFCRHRPVLAALRNDGRPGAAERYRLNAGASPAGSTSSGRREPLQSLTVAYARKTAGDGRPELPPSRPGGHCESGTGTSNGRHTPIQSFNQKEEGDHGRPAGEMRKPAVSRRSSNGWSLLVALYEVLS